METVKRKDIEQVPEGDAEAMGMDGSERGR